MSKIKYYILFFIFCFCSSVYSQWITQSSGTTSPIRDIEFLNLQTGFACGDNVLLKTTNGGENWLTLSNPVPGKTLANVDIVDSNVIYCAGWFETIIKTSNGGANWIVIRNLSSGVSYDALFFLNSETGWIAGNQQRILKTTNGGDSVITIPSFIGNIRDIYFKDSLNGVLCGEGGTVFKTTNGGFNWYEPAINLHGNLYNFLKLSRVNNQYLWMVGNLSAVYRSTNFGNNWDSISFISGADETYCSFFSSVNTGWVGGTFGRLFKTTDSGFTWRRDNTGASTAFMRSIYFLNDNTGWLCGGGGRMQKTTTGGEPLVNISNQEIEVTKDFKLYQNYPNPFNPETKIPIYLNSNGNVRIEVFNSLGKKEDEIVNEYLAAGYHEFIFNAEKHSSGLYYYRLSFNNKYFLTNKMLYVK